MQKHFRFSDFQHSAQQTSPPSNTITTYCQNALEGCFCTFRARWIELWPPFVHGTAGSGSTSKNVPNSASKKFRPNKLHPPPTVHHYSQKNRERCSLGLFDALNPAVASVCPWDCWFRRYNQKRSKFRWQKILPQQTSPPSKTITNYSQKALEGYLRTFQARWIQLWPPFVHETTGPGVISKNVPNSASQKNLPGPNSFYLNEGNKIYN